MFSLQRDANWSGNLFGLVPARNYQLISMEFPLSFLDGRSKNVSMGQIGIEHERRKTKTGNRFVYISKRWKHSNNADYTLITLLARFYHPMTICPGLDKSTRPLALTSCFSSWTSKFWQVSLCNIIFSPLKWKSGRVDILGIINAWCFKQFQTDKRK